MVFGSRDPGGEQVRELLDGSSATASTPLQAAAGADVVLLAIPWTDAREAVGGLGDLGGSILIDATNAVADDPYRPGADRTTSAAEAIGWAAPGAKVVKAFNCLHFKTMAEPDAFEQRPVVFFCGDDAGAKTVVAGLISELGLEPADAGPLAAAPLVESAGALWIDLGFRQGQGPDFAWSLARRTGG